VVGNLMVGKMEHFEIEKHVYQQAKSQSAKSRINRQLLADLMYL
jgi:hypothetical protein